MTYKVILIILVFFLFGGNPIHSQRDIDQEIIVTLDDRYNVNDLTSYLTSSRNEGTKLLRKLAQDEEWYLVEAEGNRISIIRSLQSSDLFAQVFPNTRVQTRKSPNDPNYALQQNLDKIDIEEVWNVTTGGKTIDDDEIVIAVLDDGFRLELEDWGDNLYNNPHDQPGDMNNDGCPGICGVDDDGDGLIDEDNMGREPGDPNYNPAYMMDDDENGYINDMIGLNASSGNDNHPSLNHGTSVSGIIGAKSNNDIGISGINWNTKILPLSSGTSRADIIETYNYIAEMRKQYNESNGEKGAFIVACNYSLGVDRGQPEDFPIWCSMYDKMGQQGILSPVAVSNSNYNVDLEGDIPTMCGSDYIISVTSTDNNDNFAEAAFGKENVDIAAPGEDSYSIRPTSESGYGIFPGTSSATPHVTGVIGLLYSIPCSDFLNFFKDNPSKVDSLAKIIIEAGDELPSLRGLVKSGKRLNAFNAMLELATFCGGSAGELKLTNIYPNPTDDVLKFDFIADPSEKIYVKIYNILGQQVIAQDIETILFENPEGSISTVGLTPGMYILHLQQGKKNTAKRFFRI